MGGGLVADDKCLVLGCENRKSQGVFVHDDICVPCHALLSTGKINRHSRDFVTRAIKERDTAHRVLGKMLCDAINGD